MSSSITKEFFLILKSAIESINPGFLIRRSVRIVENPSSQFQTLSIDPHVDSLLFKNSNLNNKNYELNKNVYVVAFGKAALGMSMEFERLLDEKNLVKGVAILPYNDAKKYINTDESRTPQNGLLEIFPVKNSKINYYYGARNNLPDINSLEATRKVQELCKELKSGDLLICLISGGGSALLTLPENICSSENDSTTNLSLKLNTIKSLVKAGANINELNTVRSCLSQVKGGKLARLASKAKIISLIISDVIDDPLDIIASGPTCIELLNSPSEQAKRAINVLEKFDLCDKIPEQAYSFLSGLSNLSETILEENIDVLNYLIGNNKLATGSVIDKFNDLVLNSKVSKVLTNGLCGEARTCGKVYAYLAMIFLTNNKNLFLSDDSTLLTPIIENFLDNFQLRNSINDMEQNLLEEMLLKSILENKFYDLENDKLSICLVSGGETTVNMTTNSDDIADSKGGRNQEFTLAFEFTFNDLVKKLPNGLKFELLFSSFGSDGIDGPTDAAGAYFQYDSNNPSIQVDHNEIESYLNNHNSYAYFEKYNRLIKTGATGTNVSDLQILLVKY